MVRTEVPFVVIVWILITIVLVAVELHSVAFFAVFGAAGAAAAAVVAAFAPNALALQIVVAVVVAAVGVALVRPYVSRTFGPHGSGVPVRGVHGGLVGSSAFTTDEVRAQPPGHVRILGESWLAVPWNGEPIAPATAVVITAVTGTILTVRPEDQQEEPT
ncbi:MAG: NfeD-like C-terminal, partner-binding [Actinomycetota bacterium]